MMVGLLGPRQSYGGLFADPRLNTGIGQASAMINAIPERQMPAMPQRERVNPLRVLDRVLGGQTISSGLDAERERLQMEAMRPQMEAQRAMEAAQIAQLPVDLQIAFRADPAAAARALAARQTPMAAAAGTAIVTPGDPSSAFYNERREIIGDNVVGMGVPGQDPRVLFNAPESRDQALARAKAAQDFEIARGQLGVAQGQLGVNQQTANRPQVVTTGQGAVTTLITPQGEVATQIQGNAPPNPAMQEAREAVEGFRAANDRITNILGMVSGDSEAGIKPAFDLSPAKAVLYDMQLATGLTSPEAAAYGAYRSEIMSLVSEALRLNKGPQTDKDYERELQAVARNINNPEYIRARLPLIIEQNNRLAAARLRAAGQDGAAPAPAAQTNLSRAEIIAELRRRGELP
jgi:hypothetical protein